MNRQKLLKDIRALLSKEGARSIALFGSYARGEERPGSDIDLLVAFRRQKSLMEIVRIERKLAEKIGVKVDLLTEGAVSPHIREQIRREAVLLP